MEAAEASRALIIEQAKDLAENVIERLTPGDGGKPKVFRDGYTIQGALQEGSTAYFVFPPAGGVYVVTFDEAAGIYACTCPDCQNRGMACKHMFAVLTFKSQVDAETIKLRTWAIEARRLLDRQAGIVTVKAHTRNGRQIASYKRSLPLFHGRSTDAQIEAQAAEYDALHD